MSKLVLIGGPPAVGKSSALAYLERAFERCACLDADDAWRVHPLEVNDATRAIAERNIIAVLRGYLEAGYPLVFLTWVLANPQLIDHLLHGLLLKLKQIEELPYLKIDTTDLVTEAVADRIITQINKGAA